MTQKRERGQNTLLVYKVRGRGIIYKDGMSEIASPPALQCRLFKAEKVRLQHGGRGFVLTHKGSRVRRILRLGISGYARDQKFHVYIFSGPFCQSGIFFGLLVLVSAVI